MTIAPSLRLIDPTPRPESTGPRVPFLDLRVQNNDERIEMLEALSRILHHGRVLNGPEVAELESAMAARSGRGCGVGVASGTDALIVALRALGIGATVWGMPDEVIIPALSFVATANAIRLVGAEPVFCDLQPDLNIDPAKIEVLITPRTKAIMPVHWAGRIANMRRINQIAHRHKLAVIEDASQAFGSSFGDKPAGSFGRIACFSMNPMKTLNALGEAGMIVMDDPDLRDRCERLRYHGMVDKEYCVALSGNHRLDTIQAAFVLVRLKRHEENMNRRRELAHFYNENLAGVVVCPGESQFERVAYYTYTIVTNHRDELKAHLERDGIESKIHHAVLMPHQKIYETIPKGSWPCAERMMKNVLCLPLHEKMTMDQAAYVVDSIKRFRAQSVASA